MLGSCFGRRLVAVNEWITVKREERAIYTSRKKPTIQIYVRSSNTYRQNCRCLRKALFIRVVHLVDSATAGTTDDC
jgi:hypothetical protein